MRQLLILSGKGGTGKTTIASAFIRLSGAKAYADCDVDAPNLHLIYGDQPLVSEEPYYALGTASVDETKCVGCGECARHCAFGAIALENGVARVRMANCEGCKVCSYVCPVDAIDMENIPAGEIRLFKDDRTFATAELEMGRGTSGKLVSAVKSTLRENSDGAELAIIDGSPGIGCPVIASLSGVDMVLIVTEPSMSGMSDLDRIVATARGFGVKIAITVNKADINMDKTRAIEEYARENDIIFAGTIPYDSMAVKAVNKGKSIVDIDTASGRALGDVYRVVMENLV